MIETITISKAAIFGATPVVLEKLSSFNYIFGANAAGKTTISRIIADANGLEAGSVSWKGGTKLQPMVYNSDFVERNFTQSESLKGIFTLGENQVQTLSMIATAKAERDALVKNIEQLSRTLQGTDGNGGRKGEVITLESEFKERCWVEKQKYDSKLKGGLEGFMGSKEKFKDKVVLDSTSNLADLIALADLERKAGSIFGETPMQESVVQKLDFSTLLGFETAPILSKRVVGREDVDIGAMIKRLGNSDWVSAGYGFYKSNDSNCPFCQQPTSDAFSKSLSDYFDESFQKDTEAIKDLISNYSTEALRIQNQLASIIAVRSKFLDSKKLNAENDLFKALVAVNLQHLNNKKDESNRVIRLDSIRNVATAIMALIDSANEAISKHNRMVSNLTAERSTLAAQIWKFVTKELEHDFEIYKQKKNNLQKAVSSIESDISKAKLERDQKNIEIGNLEKQTTSIQPTIDGINKLLASFGFRTFSLAKAENGDFYKLVRRDGSDAKATLSDGEKTFVTFLYFYHLLKGSDSNSGMSINRIVVFDDPVSSLDSDILFLVSTLIRGLIDETRLNTAQIKQVFVLTHNTFFHKEVTYNRKRSRGALREETFWVVRRSGLVSRVDRHETNPIKTTYDLLWEEIRKSDRSNLNIQNTMRRILESYFKILGGLDLDTLCNKFVGQEKLVCKSLCSWVNDGSHSAHDDLHYSGGDLSVEQYLGVFRAIFEKENHAGHYQMMMGDAFVQNPGNSTTDA